MYVMLDIENLPSAIGLTYWLNTRASAMVRLKIAKPLARISYGRISTAYVTIRGLKAKLFQFRHNEKGSLEKPKATYS